MCRYFTEAVLDIFNCDYIIINNTLFEHNTGSGIDQISYRGNSGAVAIGYNNLTSNTFQEIEVSNSIFFNNSANANASFQTSTDIYTNYVYTGRGGALAVYKNAGIPTKLLTMIIRKCVFKKTMHAHMEVDYT